mgnify:FL=1
MNRVKDIMELASRLAPQKLASEWDNTGLQIADLEQEVDSILLSLDINEAVVDEAIRKKCQLIISHHPLLFRPIRKIGRQNYQGRLIYRIISKKINVFAMHTNLDSAEGGINDYLANIFGLSDVRPLGVRDNPALEPGPGRIGSLPAGISLQEFLQLVREKLDAEQLRYVGEEDKIIRTIAICSGSGSEYISLAAEEGADLYLTGDVKYHQAQEAEILGLALIDAGHYQTEAIVKSLLYDFFTRHLKGVKLYKSEINTDPWNYFS